MKTEDIVLIGGLAVGGLIVYSVAAKPVGDTLQAVADVVSSTGQALESDASLLDIPNDIHILYDVGYNWGDIEKDKFIYEVNRK